MVNSIEVRLLRSNVQGWNQYVERRRQRTPAWNADLSDADLSYADLSYADLSRADLSRAMLFGAEMSPVYLYGADLTDADLTSANLSGAFLERAQLRRARLIDATLTDSVMTGANLRDADLTSAVLVSASLHRAKLNRAGMVNAVLAGADLAGADLTEADLTGADLTGAVLVDANLTSAILGGNSFIGADLRGARLHRVRIYQGVDFSDAVVDPPWIQLTSRRPVQVRIDAAAELGVEELANLLRSVSVLCELAALIGGRLPSSQAQEEPDSVRILNERRDVETRFAVRRMRYGSPLVVTLIEYALASGAVGFAGRELLKGDDSKALDLLLTLCRREERASYLATRSSRARTRRALAEAEEIKARAELPERGDGPHAVAQSAETPELTRRGTSPEQALAVVRDSDLPPDVVAAIERRISELAPLLERNLNIVVGEDETTLESGEPTPLPF